MEGPKVIDLARRKFIAALGSAAAWPLAARAQQPEQMRRVGVLMPFSSDDQEVKNELTAFAQQLQSLGWTDGKNLRIDSRWSGGDSQKMQDYAKELVAAQPDVIFTRSTPATAVLLKNTRSIPIVFAVVSDPVGEGFVASVARPGGNVTGFTNYEFSMGPKWLALLKEIAPATTQLAIIRHPAMTPAGWVSAITAAGRSLGIAVTEAAVHDDNEIDE